MVQMSSVRESRSRGACFCLNYMHTLSPGHRGSRGKEPGDVCHHIIAVEGKREGDMLRRKEGRVARVGGGSTVWCDVLHAHRCHFHVIANKPSREGGKEGARQGGKRQG